MILEEGMLAPFRDRDGVCNLSQLSIRKCGPWHYSNYRKSLERLRKDIERAPRLEHNLPSPTFEIFDRLWRRAEPGHLAVPVLAFDKCVPPLTPDRVWLALDHQCAGTLCGHTLMIATILEARGAIQTAFNNIAGENYSACNGWFEDENTDEAVTARYLTRVRDLGLVCDNAALEMLTESIYPVNGTPKALSLVAENADDLMALVAQTDAKPLILFLSENSD